MGEVVLQHVERYLLSRLRAARRLALPVSVIGTSSVGTIPAPHRTTLLPRMNTRVSRVPQHSRAYKAERTQGCPNGKNFPFC